MTSMLSRLAYAVAAAVAWLAVAFPAMAEPKPGFDCAKASGPVEKLICSDAELAQLDRGLADQYGQLRPSLSPEGATLLRKSQLAWLSSRASSCASALKAAGTTGRDEAVGCLKYLYQDRTRDLMSQYRTAGSLSLEDRETSRRVPRLLVSEAGSYPLLIGKPAAQVATFNDYIRRKLNLDKGMFAASGIKLDAKPPGETTFSRYYEIGRLDSRLISIEILESHESYVGHGWRMEYAVNWDLEHGKPLHVADIFKPDQDWQQAVVAYAIKYIHENEDMRDPESFVHTDDVEDDEAWLFDDDGAVLLLGHGERSMVGASVDVPIPYDVLAPYVRADAPLPVERKP